MNRNSAYIYKLYVNNLIINYDIENFQDKFK